MMSVLALSGCQSPGKLRLAEERRYVVELQSLSATFPSADHGEFKVALDVENREPIAGAVTSVSWEIWLHGRWFAAGTQAVSQPLPLRGTSVIQLTLPVVFRRLQVTPEPTALEVGLRGGVIVSFAGAEQRLPFEVTRRVVADGAPLFQGLNEDD
jgi:hypothetical protein